MSSGSVIAYYPIKKESERIPGKNVRDFNGRPLFAVMLRTLEQCKLVSSIVVDTDSPGIASYVRNISSKAMVVDRAEHMRGSEINMNQLLTHFLTTTSGEHFLQTHATNPLLQPQTIDTAIGKYFDSLQTHDSLLSVNKFQNRFYYSDGEPLNHSLEFMQRTQDMEPIYEENSCLFIFSRTSFESNDNSRIGKKPILFETPKAESLDIDWEEDFQLAELIEHSFTQDPFRASSD